MNETNKSRQFAASAPWTWDEMVAAFRALGGTIDNIAWGTGPNGRGLFVQDPERPVRLRVPDNLLVSTDDVHFAADGLSVKDSAAVSQPTRIFFERYQRRFSWGGGALRECADFIDALDKLPAEIRSLLSSGFGMASLLAGDREQRIRKRFVGSRAIRRNGALWFAPILELANYDADGLSYIGEDGLAIEGSAESEVLLSYGILDSFRLFRSFGFAGRAVGAISLPTGQEVGPYQLRILGRTEIYAQRGGFVVPQARREGNSVEFSYLNIGHRLYPRISRAIFRTLADELQLEIDSDEVFDRIVHFNRLRFLNLLGALEAHDGDMILTLRRMIRFQLEAMSYCVGSRSLEPEAGAEETPTWRVSIN